MDIFDLPIEIIVLITELLNFNELLSLLMTSNTMMRILLPFVNQRLLFNSKVPQKYWGFITNMVIKHPRKKYPPNLSYLHLNTKRKVNTLPTTIDTLICGTWYQFSVDIHPSVKKVVFGRFFNEEVVLHEGLEYVKFGVTFNQRVVLPSTIKIVIFGTDFDQPVILPQGIEVVIFGYDFNQSLILPQGMKYIEFGYRYSRPLIIPKTTEKVEFTKIHEGQMITDMRNHN